MIRPLRIAQVAPPLERVPPLAYGGTERVVYELVVELVRRGHEVTTFASGDSVVPGRHIATVPEALRPAGYRGDPLPYVLATLSSALDHAAEFDLIHSHLEWPSLLLARVAPVPVVATFHGRLDLPWASQALAHRPEWLVAVSASQASAHPDVPWAVIHNGLTLDERPFDRRRRTDLCFVGRIAVEKGPLEAIEIAQRTGRPLRIAAKVAPVGPEREYFEGVFRPALAAAGRDIEYLGELGEADRDALFAESYAALMPGPWPEPFGLAAIEALACGTPVIARRVGALPEIVRDGVDGFFGDDVEGMAFRVAGVDGLDRPAIRAAVIERFSARRMADAYEALYRARLDAARSDAGDSEGSSELRRPEFREPSTAARLEVLAKGR